MGFMDTINAMTVNSSEGSAVNPQQNKIELLPHNQELYDMIVEKINEGEKSIFYSEGTGLGKSFIFMRLIQDFFADKKVLYIVPKIAIWDNLTHYEDFKKIENNVDMVTFTKFNTYPYDEEYCVKYDAVFVDECHHMLSDIQGKNVKQLLDDMISWDKFAFGMTATPEVNGVYVDEEMFDVSCYGLDIYQAIERGIFPKMDIAIGIKEDLDIPDNLREKFSVTGTQTLLDRVLYDYRHVTHWLAYFTTQEELEQNESELRKLFPDYKLLKIYNGCGDSSVIEEFENSIAPVILMSVSMFLEGMHLKNVGGVLLYRNIQKSHTYAQILGRLCVIGQKYTPVMVDITGSILTMKQFYVPKSSRAEGERKPYSRKDIFDVTSKNYQLLEDMSEYMNLDSRKAWSDDDDSFLKEYYSSKGPEYCSIELERARHSIIQRAYYLGLRVNKTWTEEEDNILKEYYPIEGKEAFKRLCERTIYQCYHRVYKLGLSVPDALWSKNEIDILKQYYAEEGVDVVKRLPSRSKSSISGKAKTLGLKFNMAKPGKHWTDEELNIIKEFYETEGPDVVHRLPNRTKTQIMSKASSIGLRAPIGKYPKWTDGNTQKLMELYPSIGREAFKEFPEYSEAVLKNKVKSLKLKSPRIWTSEEEKILKDNFPIIGEGIVNLIPRHDYNSCLSKARHLGLIVDSRNIWTEEEINTLVEFYPSEGSKSFKRISTKTLNQCKQKACSLGLRVNAPKQCVWSNEEDSILMKYYPLEGTRVINRLPGRTIEAIMSRAKVKGIKRIRHKN